MGVACDILIQIPKEKKHIMGETIKGIVKFHLDKDKVFKKISLSLVEKRLNLADLQRKVKPDYSTKKIWAGNHNHYEGVGTNTVTKIYLLNKPTDEYMKLRAGSFQLPFEMIIPENIPPSVKVSHIETFTAGIEYYLILKMKKPSITLTDDTYFKTKITIYSRVDSSISDKPVTAKLNTNLIKLFDSKKHVIKLEAVLEKGYFTPSSERRITFAVTNNSNVIFNIKTELICKTRIKLLSDSAKFKREVITTVETPSIPDNSISNMFCVIPVGPEQFTVRHSSMIQREYKIKVTLRLPPPHVNSFFYIPVFIGETLKMKSNEDSDEAAGASGEPMEEPPSYWKAVLCDEKFEK